MVERVNPRASQPGSDELLSATVGELLALAEAGDMEPVWKALHELLRVAMRDECGEVLVFDEEKELVCYVSSKRAHDALVNAMIDAGADHEDLCGIDAVLGSDPRS